MCRVRICKCRNVYPCTDWVVVCVLAVFHQDVDGVVADWVCVLAVSRRDVDGVVLSPAVIMAPGVEGAEPADPHCDPDNPRVMQFQEISAAAYKIKDGLPRTPCTVRRHMKMYLAPFSSA